MVVIEVMSWENHRDPSFEYVLRRSFKKNTMECYKGLSTWLDDIWHIWHVWPVWSGRFDQALLRTNFYKNFRKFKIGNSKGIFESNRSYRISNRFLTNSIFMLTMVLDCVQQSVFNKFQNNEILLFISQYCH